MIKRSGDRDVKISRGTIDRGCESNDTRAIMNPESVLQVSAGAGSGSELAVAWGIIRVSEPVSLCVSCKWAPNAGEAQTLKERARASCPRRVLSHDACVVWP